MHLGIDATNIRQGGGVTHLVQLLSAANPEAQGISKITIWCNSNVAEMFPKKLWLSIRTHLFIDTNVIARFIFQHFLLSLQMKKFGCVVAFFPGGTLPLVSTLPAVVMSQNMLPFELDKAKIFGIYSLMFLKICVLRLLQKNSFSKASGIIFLSKYAQQKINDDVKLPVLQALIPHGIEKRFITYPQVQKSIENYSIKKPFRFLYVSILMPYKHQIEVIRAIKLLRARGFPIVCQLVGSTWGWYGAMVLSEIKKLDPENRRIEDMMKLFKIGRWNVGMQKGLIHYDEETNARETNQLMNFLNEDNGNKDVMFDMMRDVYDINNIGTAEGEQMNVNDLETMEENENTQFYENEGYGIEGLDEDYTDGDYYGEDDRDDYM
jgi:glycosyltransferase involved in cell wall biosynthesis